MEPHDDVDGDDEEEREEMINKAAERIHGNIYMMSSHVLTLELIRTSIDDSKLVDTVRLPSS